MIHGRITLTAEYEGQKSVFIKSNDILTYNINHAYIKKNVHKNICKTLQNCRRTTKSSETPPLEASAEANKALD